MFRVTALASTPAFGVTTAKTLLPISAFESVYSGAVAPLIATVVVFPLVYGVVLYHWYVATSAFTVEVATAFSCVPTFSFVPTVSTYLSSAVDVALNFFSSILLIFGAATFAVAAETAVFSKLPVPVASTVIALPISAVVTVNVEPVAPAIAVPSAFH